MSEEIDMTKIKKMVEKGFKELYDKKKQKRETAFADGVRFANLQMWYILKEQENEIERLNNIINELDNFLDKQIEKENQLLNPKKGVKPYGDEKFYYEIYKSCLFDIKLKLNRLKENK